MVSFSNFGRSATKRDIQSSEVVVVLLGTSLQPGLVLLLCGLCCGGGAGAVLWSYDALLLVGMFLDFRCGCGFCFLYTQVPVSIVTMAGWLSYWAGLGSDLVYTSF